MARSSARVRVQVVQDGEVRSREDVVAVEEPLEVRVESPGGAFPLAVTMRTPGADLELAAGEEDAAAYDLRAARMRAEREVIQRALARSTGVLATAAKLLGISRPTLCSLLDAHGLAPESSKSAEESDLGPDASLRNIG